MTEGRGERATGTPNTIYDLSSVLYHALQGGASYDRYIRDAEAAGDEELVDFFGRVRDEDSTRADEARALLGERTPTTGRTGEGTPAGAPPRAEEETLPGQEETAGRTEREREEGRGLLDRAADALRAKTLSWGRGGKKPAEGGKHHEDHEGTNPYRWVGFSANTESEMGMQKGM